MITTALRVKRKRTEDPVTALYFDDTRTIENRKKIRVDNVVYRLSQTVDNLNDANSQSDSTNPSSRPTIDSTGLSLTTALGPSSISTPTLTKDLVLESGNVPDERLKQMHQQINSSQSRVFRLARPSDAFGQQHAPQSTQPESAVAADEQVPPEIMSMLDNYLEKTPANSGFGLSNHSQLLPTVHGKYPQAPVPQTAHPNKLNPAQQPSNTTADIENDTDDYVYDIYYSHQLSGTVDLEMDSTLSVPVPSTDLIGFIKFGSDDEKLFGVADDEDDSDYMGSEDDDSNAEDYYKNDYPEEESDDGYDGEVSGSGFQFVDDDYGSQAPRKTVGKKYSYSDLRDSDFDDEGEMDHDYNDAEFLEGLNESDYDLNIDEDYDDQGFDDEYLDRHAQPGRQIRANQKYLSQQHEEALEGLEYLNLGSDVDIHDDDSDDPVARALDQDEDEEDEDRVMNNGEPETMDQYRDRIFNDLQRQIDKRSKQ